MQPLTAVRGGQINANRAQGTRNRASPAPSACSPTRIRRYRPPAIADDEDAFQSTTRVSLENPFLSVTDAGLSSLTAFTPDQRDEHRHHDCNDPDRAKRKTGDRCAVN